MLYSPSVIRRSLVTRLISLSCSKTKFIILRFINYFLIYYFGLIFALYGWLVSSADHVFECHYGSSGQHTISASLYHCLQWWYIIIARTEYMLTDSVQVDDAEPKHHNIEGEEWNAKEACCIALACRSRYVNAAPHFLAKILLLSRVDHGNMMWKLSGWQRRSRLREWEGGWDHGRRWLLGRAVRTHHLLGCSRAIRRLSIVGLATLDLTCLLLVARSLSAYCWFASFGGHLLVVSSLPFYRALLGCLVNFALKSVCTRQASRCRDEVCNWEHKVEDGSADFLLDVFNAHASPKERNVDEHENFLQFGVVLQEKLT